jgi:hypothetical protein
MRDEVVVKVTAPVVTPSNGAASKWGFVGTMLTPGK